MQSGKGSLSQLYSESATTMEKLAVLKAWAEVYIVAMETKKEAETKPVKPAKIKEDDDDYGMVDELPPDSLITLVQPELPILSRLWLAALKDYALLTLPPEFASQLPSEGGAFYTPETIDSARLHYRTSWAPILHAVALWLNSTGFTIVHEPAVHTGQKTQTGTFLNQTSGGSPKTLQAINTDRLHLIFGISIEFLCSPRPENPLEHVTSCLKALCTLLDSPCAVTYIGEDPLLIVELFNVLHRLLLTCGPPSVQRQVTMVIQQTIRAAQDHLQGLVKKVHEEDNVPEEDSLITLGEGGKTGGLIPGKSIVFAALELLMFILVRHLPQLNPKVTDSPSHVLQKTTPMSEESAQLIAITVSILADLPSLCSPSGSMTVLPTILFLITGVLRETAMNSTGSHMSVPASAALQGIKTIITSPLAKSDQIHKQWKNLICSSLASILEYSKPDESKSSANEVSMLTAIALFLLSASNEVVGISSLQNGCIERFRTALNSNDPWVQQKCYQLLLSVFQQPDRALATPYIHALAPLVVEKLKAVENQKPINSAELQAVQEGIKVLEALVNLGEEQNRPQLLALLVPTLISYLLSEKTFNSAPKTSKGLHEVALQDLMRIGPLYPGAFKAVMGAAPELKSKLEAAIRASQASLQAKAAAQQMKPAVQAAPTIKLKTSFF